MFVLVFALVMKEFDISFLFWLPASDGNTFKQKHQDCTICIEGALQQDHSINISTCLTKP